MSETTMRDANCIFCMIVAGEIPAQKLYEDEQVLAFLDVGPLSKGHALVIPKAHYGRLDAMSGDLAAACMRVVPGLSRAIREALGLGEDWAFNVLQNNGKLAHQAVGHVHFHVIPKTAEAGLEIGWPAGKLGEEEGRALRAKIVEAMG